MFYLTVLSTSTYADTDFVINGCFLGFKPSYVPLMIQTISCSLSKIFMAQKKIASL